MKQKTSTEYITPEQFQAITRTLIGLRISRAWRSDGSIVYFELGQLSPHHYTRKDGSILTRYYGEASIYLELGWRVERLRSIFFGSSSSRKRIDNCLKKMEGLEVMDISIQGRLPELVVQLSDGFWLQSFSSDEGQPEWDLRFGEDASKGKYLESKNGKIVLLK